jgi:hypothetical protein
MGHGVFRVYTATMAAAATTATFDLGRSFRQVYLQIPTFASISALDLYAAASAAGTYYQVGKPLVSTTTVESWTFSVAATATSGGRMLPIPGGLQYFQVKATDSAPAGAMTFKAICAD